MGIQQYYRSTGLAKPFDFGNALWSDNVDDSVHIPYSESMDFTGKSFTITCWALREEPVTASWPSLLTNWNGVTTAGNQHWGFMFGSNGLGINTRIRTGGSVNFERSGSGQGIADFVFDAWDFRAYQVDLLGVNGAANTVAVSDSRINRNTSGTQGTTLWMGGPANEAALNYSFLNNIWTFNTNTGSAGSRNKKYIDTVAFFDRALTDAEVRVLFGKGRGYLPTKIPGCVACYLFDESPGTAIASSAQTPGSPASRIILDQSGNGNHAYATGYGAGSTDFVNHHTLT